jgi:hypothetical protein
MGPLSVLKSLGQSYMTDACPPGNTLRSALCLRWCEVERHLFLLYFAYDIFTTSGSK